MVWLFPPLCTSIHFQCFQCSLHCLIHIDKHLNFYNTLLNLFFRTAKVWDSVRRRGTASSMTSCSRSITNKILVALQLQRTPTNHHRGTPTRDQTLGTQARIQGTPTRDQLQGTQARDQPQGTRQGTRTRDKPQGTIQGTQANNHLQDTTQGTRTRVGRRVPKEWSTRSSITLQRWSTIWSRQHSRVLRQWGTVICRGQSELPNGETENYGYSRWCFVFQTKVAKINPLLVICAFYDAWHLVSTVLPKQLSSSSSFPLELKFRPLSIYLQPLVWFICFQILIFGWKLRTVVVCRWTLVYTCGAMRLVLIYLQILVWNSNSNWAVQDALSI